MIDYGLLDGVGGEQCEQYGGGQLELWLWFVGWWWCDFFEDVVVDCFVGIGCGCVFCLCCGFVEIVGYLFDEFMGGCCVDFVGVGGCQLLLVFGQFVVGLFVGVLVVFVDGFGYVCDDLCLGGWIVCFELFGEIQFVVVYDEGVV